MTDTPNLKQAPKQQTEKKQHAKNLRFFLGALTLIILTAIALILTDLGLPKQNATSTTSQVSPPTLKKSILNTVQPNSQAKSPPTPKTAFSTEQKESFYHINQVILSVQLSYYALVNEQNTGSASDWLKLAMQQIKHAKIKSDVTTDILQQLAELRTDILHTQKIPIEKIHHTLQEVQEKIDTLQQPSVSPSSITTVTTSTPKPTTNTILRWLTTHWQNLWSTVQNWVQQSIHVETINHGTFLTLQNTISQPFFYEESKRLLDHARMAADYHDQEGFNYTCAQLKAMAAFYLVDKKIQEELMSELDQLQNMPVRHTLPNYFPVLQALNLAHGLEEPTPTSSPPVSTSPPPENPNSTSNSTNQTYLTVDTAKT